MCETPEAGHAPTAPLHAVSDDWIVPHTDNAGRNRLRFTGRISGHRLAPGGYRLRVIARSGGRKSAPGIAGFQIEA